MLIFETLQVLLSLKDEFLEFVRSSSISRWNCHNPRGIKLPRRLRLA